MKNTGGKLLVFQSGKFHHVLFCFSSKLGYFHIFLVDTCHCRHSWICDTPHIFQNIVHMFPLFNPAPTLYNDLQTVPTRTSMTLRTSVFIFLPKCELRQVYIKTLCTPIYKNIVHIFPLFNPATTLYNDLQSFPTRTSMALRTSAFIFLPKCELCQVALMKNMDYNPRIHLDLVP